MNRVYHKYLDSFVVVLIDEILVYSAIHQVCVENLKTVLEVLSERMLFAELKKCVFSLEEVLLLGHAVSKDGNAVHPKRIEAIVEWEQPPRVRLIRGFLGFDGYYHRFIV